VERIRKSWRTAWLVGEIGKLLPKIDYLLPTHTRRAGNKPAHWLANWGCRNRGKEIDSVGLPHLNQEEKAQLQQLLRVDEGGNGMNEMNGQDQAARNGGEDNLQQQRSDNPSVGKGRGERQAHVGQVTGHDKNGQSSGRDAGAETPSRNDLEPAPEFGRLDRERTTGGIRSKERLRQELQGGAWNNEP